MTRPIRRQAVEWHSACARSFAAASTLPAESVSIDAAVGRILAQEVRTLYELPHYSSSAMDGWAVAGEAPWKIVEPEDAAASSLRPGHATVVVTGGLIPPGTRGVLRSENATVSASSSLPRFLTRGVAAAADEPQEGKHIRPAGEEAARDDTVIRAGTLLNPAHVALAAIAGHDILEVVAEPRVAMLFTGDEVIQSGRPRPGQVRDSFGPQLPAFVRMLGGRVVSRQRIGDDPAATLAALGQGGSKQSSSKQTGTEQTGTEQTSPEQTRTQVVITTGGTGDSAADHLRGVLRELDAEFIIDGVAMRPGGPSLLARLPDGRFVTCLPGNPLAAMMGMLTLAAPLLAALGGRRQPSTGSVAVAVDIAGRYGTSMLMPYRLVDDVAVPNGWSGSGMMRGLADANGVLVVPGDGVRVGETAETIGFPWPT
ncbi:MAG: molybdopterin molybdenumtransferase MoeA [Glaciihabitans sp.]|nr:molybdopterin molybdenumtransferase MoeA [Glaciihabitans sp.]